jgi:hypothetical protein
MKADGVKAVEHMNLAEMLLNGAEVIRNPSDEPMINRSIAFSLETIAKHVLDVRAGHTTLIEFCDMYGLKAMIGDAERVPVAAGQLGLFE